MAHLYNEEHSSFPKCKIAESCIKANVCQAATSDAYDAPVNYRRASRIMLVTGNILKI